MLILVPIKRVPDPYATVRPLPDGSGLNYSGVKFEINPFDEIAMEEAVRIKEGRPGVRIMAVSIGTPECEEQLRKALAMGADEAVLLQVEGEMDSTLVSAELAALAKELGPGLILMGKQATDADSCQAGQMLAALLGWPQATFAAKVALSDDSVVVTRETDEGEEVRELSLPAVVTADLRLNEPRYIALPGIIKARSKPLAVRERLTQAEPKTKVTSFSSPEPRQPGIKVPTVDALLAELTARGLVNS